MKIVIGGDFVPTRSNNTLFEQGEGRQLIGEELSELIGSVDFAAFNLEVPLSDEESPIPKQGPNLIAPLKTIKGLKAVNPFFFTLANNHILDQGEQGLKSTLKILEENNISFAGVGMNLNEAKKPFVFEKDGIKLGIYCCADHEFSIASSGKAGANPFDALETPDEIEELKKKCDFVVVLYHGGKEHYRYPSPKLQKTCRKLIEKGANLVVCQHSHCIGCEEKYADGTIVYGQGNFLFDYSNNKCWETGLLIQLDNDFNISYVPVVKNGNTVKKAVGDKAEEIIKPFNERSEQIKNPDFVGSEYEKFSREMLDSYLISFQGKRYTSVLRRAVNKLSGYKISKRMASKQYPKAELLMLQNYITCEAHNELILQGIEDKLKNEK